MLEIPNQLAKYFTNSEAGTGIIIYDKIKLPFMNPFPVDSPLYRLITTDPKDLKRYAKEAETKEEEKDEFSATG